MGLPRCPINNGPDQMKLFFNTSTLAVQALLVALLLSSGLVSAQETSLQREVASPQNIETNQADGELVIDIRTPEEWEQTGVVDGAVPLQFFDARGNYDAEAFIESVTAMAPPGSRIGIICRTASRSGPVSDLMAEQGWQVTDYQGGMVALDHHGYQTVSLSQALNDLDGTAYCDTPLAAC